MRAVLVILILLCFQLPGYGQEREPKISIQFTSLDAKQLLLEIEKLSGYRVLFEASWLPEQSVSGDYTDTPISTILDAILENTNLNYYIWEKGYIIITRNTIIRDQLPPGFSPENAEDETEEAPPLQNNAPYLEANSAVEERSIRTFRIGREQKNNSQQRYTLEGRVINAVNGRGISNLALVIRGSTLGTVTGTDGTYTIRLQPGIYVIQARGIGYETLEQRVILFNDGELNFTISESAEQLEEVVVESNRLKNVEEVVTGVVDLEVAEIKNIPLVLGERDILKTAITLPGISNTGEGAAGYNVRGGATDQNLILLDDAVIYNPSHFFGIFSALNPFTTGKVTIYKGSIPASYGGRLSSVFDITTRKADIKKFSGEVSIGPVTSNITLETPIVKDKSGILIGGRSTYSNWILRTLDDPSLKNSTASFFDVIAKYNDSINSKNNITATAYISRDAFSITSDSVYSYSNRMLSFKWNHKLNERNSMNVLLANSAYGFNIEFEGTADKNFDLGYTLNETELKLKVLSLLPSKHRIEYGISSKYYVVNPGEVDPIGNNSIVNSLTIPREKALESAVFISDNFPINKQLSVDLGVRFSVYAALGESLQRIYNEGVPKDEGSLLEIREYNNNEIIKTYGGPEFRASARYFLTPDFSVKASYNNAFQYIHTLSSNTTVSPTDTWKLSDTNIAPQRAEQLSVGFYKNFEDNNYEMSIEGYYKRSRNILDYKVGAQLLLNQAIETEVLQGEGRAYGVEFLLKKTSGRLNGWLGYTYSRAMIKLDSAFDEERINNGDYFPSNYDKPHDFSLVSNYKFTKRFSLSANFVYQTGRPVTFPVGTFFLNGSEYALYSDRNKFRIPDFYRLDLSFNIEGNHKIKKFAHSFWNISIYNVLGRNNPYSVFFVTENGKLQAYKSSIFSIPVPTITYNFKF